MVHVHYRKVLSAAAQALAGLEVSQSARASS